MAVSLKKSPVIREYTPEHLMDEEEAVRKFCPPRESGENSIVPIVITKDDLPIEKSEAEISPNIEKTETKAEKAVDIALIALCILCIAAGLGMLIFTVYNTVTGLQDAVSIADKTERIASLFTLLFKEVIQGLCSIALISTPKLIHGLLNCRRF